MATPLATGMVLKMTAYHTAGAQTGIVTAHFVIGSVGNPSASDSDIVPLLSASWSTVIKPAMGDQASYSGMELRIITTPPPASVLSPNGAGAGTGGANILPPAVSGLISLRTRLGGRSYRGRAYIPFPWGESITADGKPTGDYLNGLAGIRDWFLSNKTFAVPGFGQTLITPVVYSQKLGTWQGITLALRRPEFATQRRRSYLNRGDKSPFS